MKLLKYILLPLVFFVQFCCFTDSLKAQDKIEHPNIIIIYTDDIWYGDIGAYGAKKIPTPEVDKLADEGMLFTNAYAIAATCTPIRYSLLTGRYAFRNEQAQVLAGDDPLLIKPGSRTLLALLKGEGYRTSVVGKWHLGMGEGPYASTPLTEGLIWT